MAQRDDPNRDWQLTRDQQDDSEEESSSADESRSPISLASETEPSLQDDTSTRGTPIHHPQFTNKREKLGNEVTNGVLAKPIPVHATLGSLPERETSSEHSEENGSKHKRVLSSNQLNVLSYETTDIPCASNEESSTTQPMPTKRIRFMSIDEILTTAKQNDTHYVSPSFALESVEELDLQLGEELQPTGLLENKMTGGGMNHHAFSNPATSITTASQQATVSPRVSPVCVPLLTPPQSPRQSFVEWPSNLVIESALMSVANEIRPFSPASLTGEEDEEEMETARDANTTMIVGDGPSTLTKRLSFITVGSN